MYVIPENLVIVLDFALGPLHHLGRRYANLFDEYVDRKNQHYMIISFSIVDGIQNLFDEENREYGVKQIYYFSVMRLLIITYNLAYFVAKDDKSVAMKRKLEDGARFLLDFFNNHGVKVSYELKDPNDIQKFSIEEIIEEIDDICSCDENTDLGIEWMKWIKVFDEIFFNSKKNTYIHYNPRHTSDFNRKNLPPKLVIVKNEDLTIPSAIHQRFYDFFFEEKYHLNEETGQKSLFEYCKDRIISKIKEIDFPSGVVIANLRDLINHFARFYFDLRLNINLEVNLNIGEIWGHLQRATTEIYEHYAHVIRNKLIKYRTKRSRIIFYIAWKKPPSENLDELILRIEENYFNASQLKGKGNYLDLTFLPHKWKNLFINRGLLTESIDENKNFISSIEYFQEVISLGEGITSELHLKNRILKIYLLTIAIIVGFSVMVGIISDILSISQFFR
jgi:hypothetical protein